jgi:hypothetical protein
MIRGRWAPHCCMLAAMAFCSYSRAGVWGIDPVLGVLGDYSTDPNLLHQRDTEISSGAVQLASPTTYVDDNFEFSAVPDFRVGDSRGFAAVTSDYAHLNLKAEYDTDRTAFTANAGLARDSSLAYDYLSNGDVGVRRDAATAALNWSRHLTERLDFSTDVNAQRVLFGDTTLATLTDYEYGSIAPTVSWHASERSQFGFSGSVSRYHSIDDRDQNGFPISTESVSANLVLYYKGQLSEQWSLTAAGGYSRAVDKTIFTLSVPVSIPFFGTFIVHLPDDVAESAQTGSLYSLNLAYQGDQLSLNVIASRQLIPTGFAFLTSQDVYELKASDKVSERWSFGADARYVRYQNPPVSGFAPTDVATKYFGLNANWNWTEHSTVTLSAARVVQAADSNHFDVASNEVTLTLSHRFNHLDFM